MLHNCKFKILNVSCSADLQLAFPKERIRRNCLGTWYFLICCNVFFYNQVPNGTQPCLNKYKIYQLTPIATTINSLHKTIRIHG